jgi:hypothetical protein
MTTESFFSQCWQMGGMGGGGASGCGVSVITVGNVSGYALNRNGALFRLHLHGLRCKLSRMTQTHLPIASWTFANGSKLDIYGPTAGFTSGSTLRRSVGARGASLTALAQPATVTRKRVTRRRRRQNNQQIVQG